MKIGLVNCISLVSFDEISLESGVGGCADLCDMPVKSIGRHGA